MTTKTDYTPEEWLSLLVAPYYTAMLIVTADPNMGFISELAAMVQAVKVTETGTKNDLIRDIAVDLGKKETQEAIKPELEKVKGQQDPQAIKKTLLDNVLAAADLIGAKSPDDSNAFRRWLLYVAQQTAEGSKEGSFLGIGGVRVSEKEKAMLAELSQVLGVEAPTT